MLDTDKLIEKLNEQHREIAEHHKKTDTELGDCKIRLQSIEQKMARKPLWEIGLDYEHGTGHGVGSFLSVHEGPQRISKLANAVALRPGMIVSNEPGYYKEGGYGIRIENLILVQKADEAGKFLHFETLTLAPIDRNLVDVSLLSAEELAWLNAYHARVLKEIGPQVDAPIRMWLGRATAPLSR